jgi:hypothetical protein
MRESKQMTLARQQRDTWYSPVTGKHSFATEIVLCYWKNKANLTQRFAQEQIVTSFLENYV